VAAILGYILSEAMACGRRVADWGWRIPFFVGLPDHPLHLPAAAGRWRRRPEFLAMKKHPTASEVFCLRARQLAHRDPWHDDRRPDHDDLLFRHRLYADLRQEPCLKLTSQDAPDRDTIGGGDQLHLESGRRRRLSDRIGRKPVLLTIAGLAFVTAYPALHWLVADPSFGKMLAVEMMFSFYFGVYSGTMLGCLVEIVPGACPHHLLLNGLRTGRGAVSAPSRRSRRHG